MPSFAILSIVILAAIAPKAASVPALFPVNTTAVKSINITAITHANVAAFAPVNATILKRVNATTIKPSNVTAAVSVSATEIEARGHENQGFARFQLVGCYGNHEHERALSVYVEVFGELSVRSCCSACSRYGFPYSGIKYGRECWCDHQIRYQHPGSIGSCSYRCGHGGEYCGGHDAVSVYKEVNKKPCSFDSCWGRYDSRRCCNQGYGTCKNQCTKDGFWSSSIGGRDEGIKDEREK
ncbi:hypothetical protein CC78DRAFT_584373 [Lojkania enalia]|uniref:WSC domain-containing protein n=1 Tax=Lojkania enalia TaxID=147567 RepID=A0A9P4K2D6_9PLEO|nr:hypothetical protein CC78DRAFT_584373 [Didymosphaeria enalia]